MKISKPESIAICLNAPTVERAKEQKEELKSLEDRYTVEWDIRAERFSGLYPSFSQMINESVICTESEFMIFINPKSEVKPEDVDKIIGDLCSGYALSSTIAFGFWGTTKELFRKIGLFDERFLGGGAEDNDFMIRMKYADIASSFEYQKDRYQNQGLQKISEFRIVARSIFEEKWIINNNICRRSSDYALEKYLPTKIQQASRPDISNSWFKWNESRVSDHGVWGDADELTLQRELVDFKWTAVNANLGLHLQADGYLVANLVSSPDCKIIFRLTKQINWQEHEAVRGNIHGTLKSGVQGWKWKPDPNQYYSIRLAYDGKIIYASDFIKIPFQPINFTFKAKQHLI